MDEDEDDLSGRELEIGLEKVCLCLYVGFDDDKEATVQRW